VAMPVIAPTDVALLHVGFAGYIALGLLGMSPSSERCQNHRAHHDALQLYHVLQTVPKTVCMALRSS
jgi:hypothetical protein